MFIQNLQYKLHKLNTAQIITLSFAGVIFVGGLILWLPVYSTGTNHIIFRCHVYSNYMRMCYRFGNCSHSYPLELNRQAGNLAADTDGRNWFDCAGKCDFHLFK